MHILFTVTHALHSVLDSLFYTFLLLPFLHLPTLPAVAPIFILQSYLPYRRTRYALIFVLKLHLLHGLYFLRFGIFYLILYDFLFSISFIWFENELLLLLFISIRCEHLFLLYPFESLLLQKVFSPYRPLHMSRAVP
jgi:hypothetical protein